MRIRIILPTWWVCLFNPSLGLSLCHPPELWFAGSYLDKKKTCYSTTYTYRKKNVRMTCLLVDKGL